MVDFAYTNVTGKIPVLLQKIRTVGVPPKVSTPWLKTIGFTSSNDRTLVGVLRFIGFIDGSDVPTPTWNAYRGANYREVLGEAIRKGYADLFAVYPDAESRSNTELTHVFSTSSSGGAQVIGRLVATFKALVEQADFPDSGSGAEASMSAGPLHVPPVPGGRANPPALPGGPALHIDIQIHISPESSAQQIDKIFESMAKHLYGPRAAAE